MPTERFFNLSQSKKKMILDSVCQEILNPACRPVNVGRISRTAKISRASFYSYFKDKQDLIDYLFQIIWVKQEHSILEDLKAEQGNLHDALLKQITDITRMNNNAQMIYVRFYKTVMEQTEQQKKFRYTEEQSLTKEEYKKFIHDCYQIMNTENYPGLDEEKLGYLMELGFLILLKTAVRSINGYEKKENLEQTASIQLRLLESGIK